MPSRWQDLIFEERIEAILRIFPSLSDEDKRAAVDEWADMEFEYEQPLWRDEEEVSLDGKFSALGELQNICERRVREKYGLKHPTNKEI